jgi:plasmid stabilization system protein ParE
MCVHNYAVLFLFTICGQHASNNASKKHTASTIRNILRSPASQPEMFLKCQSIYGPSLLQDFQQGPHNIIFEQRGTRSSVNAVEKVIGFNHALK